ncbi:Neurogenic locus notch -like protein 3 [Trichinella papuae]|uniref:Neurogenic locus notch-like protein 3 n=1 Tax=Trichinella papuae TaxID=268474 RepID=A0A0V1N6G5_9BILA|nr:Neurogenic locus notch -like protein 3 [Trichinella papuae]
MGNRLFKNFSKIVALLCLVLHLTSSELFGSCPNGIREGVYDSTNNRCLIMVEINLVDVEPNWFESASNSCTTKYPDSKLFSWFNERGQIAMIKDVIFKLSGNRTEFTVLNGLYIADLVNNEYDSTLSWEFSNITDTMEEQLYIMYNTTHQYEWEYETKLPLATKDIYDIYHLFYSTPICMVHKINVDKTEFSEKAIPVECYNITAIGVKALCSITYDGPQTVNRCDEGFQGVFCNETIKTTSTTEFPPLYNISEACANLNCSDHGVCVETDGNYTCKCYPGYTGENCEKEHRRFVNPLGCLNGPFCGKNGDCYQSGDDWKCACHPGFTGIRCEESIDLCDIYNPCLNNGKCTTVNGQLRCKCNKYHVGEFCDFNVDQCINTTINCGKAGRCVRLNNIEKCWCNAGFTGKECEEKVDLCDENNMCNYANQCSTVHEETHSYMQCKCNDWESGKYCTQRRSICNIKGPCLSRGVCGLLDDDSYVCHCKQGYHGKFCEIERIHACDNNSTCGEYGKCIRLGNDFLCQCNFGFTGKYCETKLNSCEFKPCGLNGKCNRKDDGYECICDPGYTGYFCENTIDMCYTLNPCRRGRCISRINGFQCICPEGYMGMACEQKYESCNSDLCLNGGTCYMVGEELRCHCQPGYKGAKCARKNDICKRHKNICGSNGRCVYDETDGQISCSCNIGYDGKYCEKKVASCFNGNPCRHGNCTLGEKSFNCQCPPDVTGELCAIGKTAVDDTDTDTFDDEDILDDEVDETIKNGNKYFALLAIAYSMAIMGWIVAIVMMVIYYKNKKTGLPTTVDSQTASVSNSANVETENGSQPEA